MDTTPEVDEILLEGFRQMPAQRKLQSVGDVRFDTARRRVRMALLCVIWLLCAGRAVAQPSATSRLTEQSPDIRANDNQAPAGKIENGALTLSLEIAAGRWHPEAQDGTFTIVAAFGEEGKALQIPGPAIRVTEGTSIHISIRNRCHSAVRIYGFHRRPGDADQALEVPPGALRNVRFSPGMPGIYFYWAAMENRKFWERINEDSQLYGIIVVEPAAVASFRANEHVLVLGHWYRSGDPKANPPTEEHELWVINGKMWPYTERFTQRVGEPLQTFWINASDEDHPMHLHGTYFTILSEGDSERDIAHEPGLRPFVATRVLESGKTMEIEWTPQHAGNWLFHCHILFHTGFWLGLDPFNMEMAHMGDSLRHMAGLAVGFTAVAAKPEDAAAPETPRKLDLFIAERQQHYEGIPGVADQFTGMGYSLQEAGTPLLPPSAPGPPIVLQRGRPVEITIQNQLKEPTSVHWHGIELESYYDGVPAWGGDARGVTPAIPAGGTFVARFTPPRAGSFMYHTHLNDFLQMSLGLCGPLVILDPQQPQNPDTDRLFFISRDGPSDEKAPFQLNGMSFPPPLYMHARMPVRMRFFELTTAMHAKVILLHGGQAVTWKAIAKDGADLPQSQATVQPASQWINTGETYDFEWTPDAGDYRLEGRNGKGILLFEQDVFVRQASQH